MTSALSAQTLLTDATRRLEAAGLRLPEAEAEIILSHFLGLPREKVRAGAEVTVITELQEKIEEAVAARAARKPLGRILGAIAFRGLPIAVGDGVFEPGHDVEAIVEHAHILLEKKSGPVRILDCGTGTGCILLALLNEMPLATGVGIDISEAAVALAKKNAVACGLGARAEFRANDWTDGMVETFDLIVANPPFIPTSVLPTLAPEVRMHDPLEALHGGRDGLRFYRRSARDFQRLTRPGGVGLFQISPTYAEGVLAMFQREGYRGAEIKRNYYGIPMCIAIAREDYKPDYTACFVTALQKFLKKVDGA
jgi:release factor glutamine methyltransferase